jgi:haloalkane dehalogenase
MDLPAGRMHYVDEGHGAPIVFVHGTPTWSYEWRHVVRALARTHRCIAPDHLGFGLSDRPRNFPYTPEAHAESFAAFITRLNPPPFTLVVHDFGGPIACSGRSLTPCSDPRGTTRASGRGATVCAAGRRS